MSTLPMPIPPTTEREIHLRDYARLVWNGRFVVLACFLLVVAGTAAYSFLKTPIYRAMAVVEVQPQARRLGPGQDVSGLGVASYGWFAEERYQYTQIEVIRSRAVAETAFEALGLRRDPLFAAAVDPVAAFAGSVKVQARRDTGLIEITVEGPNPAEAARWANAVADAYVQRNIDRARTNADSAVEALRALTKKLTGEVQAAEDSRLDALERTQIYNPENQQLIVKQKLEKLNGELVQMRIKVVNLRALLDKVEEIRETGADPTTLPELASDPVLVELNRQRVDLEKQLDGAKITFRPGAPQYQEVSTKLDRVKLRMRDQIANDLAKIQTEYSIAQKSQADYEREIRETEQGAYRLSVVTSKYDVEKTDAETKRQVFSVITKTLNDIAVTAQLLSNNVSVLDHAIPPRNPIRPRKILNVIIGAMAGLSLGIGAAFFLDYLDNTLRTAEDVERYLGLGVLSVIPRFTGDERGARVVKEAYQTLRTSLIFSSANREKKVVLVCSTSPQEGKSSTAASLARALSGAGERVLVIDCDLRRPTQHLHLKVPRDEGLTNYLVAPRGQADWRNFVKSIGTENLHAITSGPVPPNPPELLGSDRFAALLQEVREHYQWIILDSPPVLSISDAVFLGSLADLVMLVVRYNRTERALIRRALGQFRGVGATVAGVVLNDVDLGRAGDKAYYSGYYEPATEEAAGKKATA